jgi:thiamine-phosphate pyrophosphorylase
MEALNELFALAVPQPIAGMSDTTVPLSGSSEAVLEFGRDLARELSHDHAVTTDQLLLALLEREEELCERLRKLGLEFSQLREKVMSMQPRPLQLDEPLELTDPVDNIDIARILDAAANRAREALRVIEDYCRFVLDDAFLSGELKQMRHQMAELLSQLPPALMLEARDTLNDVGTAITTTHEQERFSALAVVQANLKRLQETLRCLEEFGKLHSPYLGSALEKLRYQSYTLEKAIVLGMTARQRLADARLYVLVTGSRCTASLEWTIQEAAAGGAQIFQLREKSLSDRDLVERARKVRKWTRQAGTLFIMNDRPDIARLVEADGVHLGQDDMAVKEARRILGPEALIGVSTHNLEQLRQAVLEGASYIGVGPTFPSGTKSFEQLAGLDFVRQAAAETTLPVFVIGGVNLENLSMAIEAGARRVAVSQSICQADDPQAVAARFRQQLG